MSGADKRIDWDDRDLFEDEESVENENDVYVPPADFDRLLIAPSDWTVGTIYQLIGKQIQLNPEYQRRNVWQAKAKSQFIESLMLGIPIPQILLASRAGQKNQFFVIDGKQRLNAIKEFFDGRHADGKVFKLKDLRILSDLKDFTWKDIESDDELSSKLLNEPVRTTVLRGWQDESVLYEIFYRLNSASVRLSPMELRMSLLPGDFLKYIILWTENIGPIHRLLRKRQPDARMSDVELAIRFLAFNDQKVQYQGDLKKFLDEFCTLKNSEFSEDSAASRVCDSQLFEMDEAISAGFIEFGDKEFCRKYSPEGYETRFNRAVFDVLVGSLANRSVRDWVAQNQGQMKALYEVVCLNNPDFVKSVESTTKSPEATRTRFSTWYTALSSACGVPLNVPNVK